jgi:membrane fusion protein, copper/silver efflux system
MSILNPLSLVGRVPGGWKVVAVVGAAFLLGFLIRGGGEESHSPHPDESAVAAASTVYTCSMHPQIRLSDPNARCPICGMELIPVTGGSDGDGPPRRLTMSESARALADIETAPVLRKFVVREVRLAGIIDYDETRRRSITAWVPGRLDRLFVDSTGVAVRKGTPLAYLYSPELLVAQQALLKADQAFEEMKSSGVEALNLGLQQGTVVALVDRLRLWGLSAEQIGDIRERKTASEHMTVLSPISGIVIHKNVVEGETVEVGSKMYEVADLSRVWVYLDVYEADLNWIRYAQEVRFEAEARPGEVFRGRISFIDPFLDQKTRTVRVRVSVDNADGRLKPGMFVRARVLSTLAGDGKIAEPSLAGKWISPVHPEVIADRPGDCDICGTPLVSAESLGYVGSDATPPLVIPATAVLKTGKRSLVYVRVPSADRPTFEGREVTLGPRTKDHYLVRGGLEEGERVVVRGNFKIDSALQILARPSMMSSSEGGGSPPELEVPTEFVSSLSPLLRAYLEVKTALSEDDLDEARRAAEATLLAVKDVEIRLLSGPAHERWMKLRPMIAAGASQGEEALDIAGVRAAFDKLSVAVLETVRDFGQATGVDLYEQRCPMAFDNRGASWLSDSAAILNPYFGASMLRCGEVVRVLPERSGDE